MNRYRLAWILVLVGAAAVLASCAKQRDPINRVQPYALKKSYFVGEDLQDPMDNPEFWTQATLIDVPYGASQDGLFQSTYTQNLSRIRWQVTEDYLLGRLAYERIDDSDGKGAGAATNDGIIVVAFRIEKHFDIVRAYNPTTGERLNIYEENASDRPWYEREYMRVDWSKNENTDAYDFDTLSMLGIFGGIIYEPMAYDVTDPMSVDAPQFDLDNGYFDITNKAFAKPQSIDLSHLGWGIDSFPACMLPKEFSGGSEPVASCNPVELTIRQSFRRVEDNDYEPKHWDGYRFQAVGGFYLERYGYDRNYGMSDDKWRRFLNVYQIWNRSHFYADPQNMTGHVACYTPETTPYGGDPHRDDDGNGTEDECEEVGMGSKCDTFRQRCTLPYTSRTLKTIPWYFTKGESLEFFDATAAAAHEWDVALRVAARAAQYAECKAIGSADCATHFPVYFGQADDNRDAIDLAREVDDCRAGKAYAGQDCNALAQQLGEQRGYDSAVISIAQMEEVLVLCHSPVETGDHPACGDQRLPADLSSADCAKARADGDRETQATCNEALTVRQGDLRYHKINVFKAPASPSPWGIYSDAKDPLTGQIIACSVNVWGHVNDFISQYYIDVLRYMKGELETSQITEGEYVRKWVQAQDAASKGGVLPRLSKSQIKRRVASFAGVAESALPNPADMDPAFAAQMRQVKQKLTGYRFDSKQMSTNRAMYAARQRSAAGTAFEAELMTPMVEQLMGVTGMPLTEGVMNHASMLRRGNPSFQRDYRRMHQNALAERGICVMHGEKAAAPLSLGGLADKLEAKFGAFNANDSEAVQNERAEKMRQYLSRRLHYSVIAHEMGHSVGMRHNFVSSSDAWQFRPQYWQLRTKNGTVTQPCTDLTTDGASCVGPRWFDPVTQEERDNMIWRWMHSSVMEYAGDITQDMMGLGVYDFAAMRMFYGDVTSVGADPSWGTSGQHRSAMFGKMDNFGGILGIQWSDAGGDYHYSQLQNKLSLIRNCYTVPDPTIYRPATWDEEADGTWNPVLDGMLVQVDGQWTRCEQPEVDYVPWTSLRTPTAAETGGAFYRGGPAVDKEGRIRMPYGFGTDRWADLGNLSVYRHDNGADPYEIFNFLITQQEVGHIFDNYRRGRQTFSVRSQANRTLSRYNEKIRDGAKGLGLMRNIYKEFALNSGWDFHTYWPFIASAFFPDNILASGMVFDHFTRTMARPEVGEHYKPAGDTVLRSELDDFGQGGTTILTIPNGATGFYESVGYGGKLVENRLADNQGEFDSDYTINCGSYYDKLNAAYLMTESVDNFISDSRMDFVDPRYRSVSMADLFPEGYRRWIASNLTDDAQLKGAHVAADAAGNPEVDSEGYPARGMGWTTWWADEPYVCFPGVGSQVCGTYGAESNTQFHPDAPANTVVVDPQVGWEQQKFLIAWTLMYLPENEEYDWLDMMDIWELGRDTDPEFTNRIEFHNPDGKVFVAKTYGKEVLFGKTVQRGIAARVLQQANDYLNAAYETTPGPDIDGDGDPDWYIPVINPTSGRPIVKYDPNIKQVNDLGQIVSGRPGCDDTDSSDCTCSANRACVRLAQYVSVPSYLREALSAYSLGHPSEAGFY